MNHCVALSDGVLHPVKIATVASNKAVRFSGRFGMNSPVTTGGQSGMRRVPDVQSLMEGRDCVKPAGMARGKLSDPIKRR